MSNAVNCEPTLDADGEPQFWVECEIEDTYWDLVDEAYDRFQDGKLDEETSK